jgi:hypothetical protein
MREAGSGPTRWHRRTQTDRMPGTPAVADLLCTDPLVDGPRRAGHPRRSGTLRVGAADQPGAGP